MKTKYAMKPLRVNKKHVISYIIYTPEGQHLCSVKKREDCAKLLAHLNREEYVAEKSNVLELKEKL